MNKRFILVVLAVLLLFGVGWFLFAQRTEVTRSDSGQPDSSWSVTIAAVGDMVMGTTYPGKRIPIDSGRVLFAQVRERLRTADVTFGNQEGPLCSGGQCTKPGNTGKHFAFRQPPYLAVALVDAGFDVVNLANNHMNDFGATGLAEARRVLDSLGIKHTGPLSDIARLEVKGGKLAIIGFSTSGGTHSLHDIPGAQRLVADLARQSDIVVVSFHGGSEGTGALHVADRNEDLFGEPRGNVWRFAHAVIDSGADLVLGHGPHVPRALELYQDRLIAYSLGNFIAYGGLSCAGECGRSFVLEARLDSTGKFLDGKIIPIQIDPPGIPKVDSSGRSLDLVRRLTHEDFPATGPAIDSTGRILCR